MSAKAGKVTMKQTTKPSAGMKIRKGEVSYESQVDHVKFTMDELIHAANGDVGRYLRREARDAIYQQYQHTYVDGDYEAQRKNRLLKKYINGVLQTWRRKKELDLQIGYKTRAWMSHQEMGDKGYPKQSILRNTVASNISQIREIQAQYLTELNRPQPRVRDPGGDLSED